MKYILTSILGVMLLASSTFALAATEIWMVHNPTCSFCNLFLDDHNIQRSSVSKTEDLGDGISLEILTPGDLKPKVLKALQEQKLPNFPGTPHFYRWDTETESVTGQWTGWRSGMNEQFLKWTVDGTHPTW